MIERRRLLYIAAPYAHPDPVANTHAACQVASIIYADRQEWVPIVPHLTMLWHAIDPRPADHWYAYDLHVLRRCQGIVRLPGESAGADREMEEAAACGLVVLRFDYLPRAARTAWLGRLP